MAKAEGGPIPAGQQRVIEITLPRGSRSANLKLNVVAIVGRSNDSFVSTRSRHRVKPLRQRSEMSVELSNFDSGSEENTGNLRRLRAGWAPPRPGWS